MTDNELIYSAGWVPCDRIGDAITEAHQALDVLWPKGGNAPDRRDVVYLLDSLRLMLFKRAERSRTTGVPVATQQSGAARQSAPQQAAKSSPLDEARQALWGFAATTPSAPAAEVPDSREELEKFRAGVAKHRPGFPNG
jgi:hypothetical protein